MGKVATTKGLRRKMETINKALSIFTRKQKMKLVIITLIILGGSLCELLGVTVILPFINVALDFNIIFENQYMLTIYDVLDLSSPRQFLILLGIVLMVVYIVKNIYLTIMNDIIYKFTYRTQKELACKLLYGYIQQP